MDSKRDKQAALRMQEVGDVEVARAVQALFPVMKLRHEPRFPFSFPVQVAGMDRQRNIFQEDTATVDISRSGCRFALRTAIAPGAFLAVAAMDAEGQAAPEPLTALYSVVWCRPVGNGYEVGVQLLDGPNLWNITFPDQLTGAW